jgi:hypothetical protein
MGVTTCRTSPQQSEGGPCGQGPSLDRAFRIRAIDAVTA